MNVMIIIAVLVVVDWYIFYTLKFSHSKIFKRNIARSRRWADGAIEFLISAPSLLVNGLRNIDHKKTKRFV